MDADKTGPLPAELARGRSRFQAWREMREPGGRIPQDLWDMAVGLARTYGVSRTAIALSLDYYSLRKRVGLPHQSWALARVGITRPIAGCRSWRARLTRPSPSTKKIAPIGSMP